MARRVYDFTITPRTVCHRCGYSLRGLRVTGRCPECATRVVETLYVAALLGERRQAEARQASFERTVFASDWALASWLGFLGGAGILVEVALGVALGALAPWGGLAVLGAASAVAMLIALLLAERLGLAGFPSRRSVVALVILLHLFAAAVAAAATQLGMEERLAVFLLPLVAIAPLTVLLRWNAPAPGVVLRIVLLVEVLALMPLAVASAIA